MFRQYQCDVTCAHWQCRVRRPMRVTLLASHTRRELHRQKRCSSWERRWMQTLREPWTASQVVPSLVTLSRADPMVTSTVQCVMWPWTVGPRLRVISWESNTRQRWTGNEIQGVPLKSFHDYILNLLKQRFHQAFQCLKIYRVSQKMFPCCGHVDNS